VLSWIGMCSKCWRLERQRVARVVHWLLLPVVDSPGSPLVGTTLEFAPRGSVPFTLRNSEVWILLVRYDGRDLRSTAAYAG